jgi:hypothetical protein
MLPPHVTPHDGLVDGLVIKIESNPVSKNFFINFEL